MIISILVNRFLIRKIFALWEEKKKKEKENTTTTKTLTFDNANKGTILIRSPVLLAVANIAWDPTVFQFVGYKLKAMSS